MRKYENVDVIATLGAIMEINTEHYKSDFKYDVEMLKRAAAAPDADNTRLLWMSRPSGTYCFRERDVYVADTSSHNTWRFYADQTKDNILAYAVELTGKESGKIKGTLYELDYRKHVAQVVKDAQPPIDVTLFQQGGAQQQISFAEYKNNSNAVLIDKYGKVERLRFEVADEGGLQQILKQAREGRQKNTPAIFKLRNSSRKPSIRAQLAEGKAAAAPQKAAAKTKSNKVEVSL